MRRGRLDREGHVAEGRRRRGGGAGREARCDGGDATDRRCHERGDARLQNRVKFFPKTS